MIWWLVVVWNVVIMCYALEDFDEVVVAYPKIGVNDLGEIIYETNATASDEVLVKWDDRPQLFEWVDTKKKLPWNSNDSTTTHTEILENDLASNADDDGGDNDDEAETHADLRKKKCPTCNCGVSLKNNRIVGGTAAKINEYPWMVYLTEFNKFFCGASVLNTDYIITAAHCVSGVNRGYLRAVFLDEDRATPDQRRFTRKIASIIRHPNYSASTQNHDIALARLERPLVFTGVLRPICLPSSGHSFAGQNGIVTGWGTTREDGQTSQKLREVTLPIISNAQCRRTANGKRITEFMLCAGGRIGRKDSCQGDSGGPLHVVVNNTYRIAGIVSWGDGCGRPNHPGVYTRVTKYLKWIIANSKEGCYCEG